MDFKKTNAEQSIVTRDIRRFDGANRQYLRGSFNHEQKTRRSN